MCLFHLHASQVRVDEQVFDSAHLEVHRKVALALRWGRGASFLLMAGG